MIGFEIKQNDKTYLFSSATGVASIIVICNPPKEPHIYLAGKECKIPKLEDGDINEKILIKIIETVEGIENSTATKALTKSDDRIAYYYKLQKLLRKKQLI